MIFIIEKTLSSFFCHNLAQLRCLTWTSNRNFREANIFNSHLLHRLVSFVVLGLKIHLLEFLLFQQFLFFLFISQKHKIIDFVTFETNWFDGLPEFFGCEVILDCLFLSMGKSDVLLLSFTIEASLDRVSFVLLVLFYVLWS